VDAFTLPALRRLYEVAEPEKGIPGANGCACDHANLSKSSVFIEVTIDSFHRTSLKGALGTTPGQHDTDPTDIRKFVLLWRDAGKNVWVANGISDWLNSKLHENPIQQGGCVVGKYESG
jgi:hypothetical protein